MPWQVLVCEPGRTLLARDLLKEQDYTVFLPMMRQHKRTREADGMMRLNSFDTPLFAPYLFVADAMKTEWENVRYISGVLRGANGSGVLPDRLMGALLRVADEEDVIIGRELPRVKNGRCIDFVANVGDLCNISLVDSTLVGIITDLSQVEKTGFVGVLIEMLGRQCASVAHYRSIERLDGRVAPTGQNRKERRLALQRERQVQLA